MKMAHTSKMSELQNFLLVVDHNKQEAIQIAEVTAQSKLCCMSLANQHTWFSH
jgi:hypothetical protein